MAKATSTPTSSNAVLVAAILGAGSRTKRGSMTERVGDGIVQAGTAATRFVGQLSVAVDANHFHDGALRQKLSSTRERISYNEQTARDNGLSLEEMAQLIDSRHG